MASQVHRRQVLLFFLAVLLPCSVLVVLGLRMIAQEHELSEKRLGDEQQRLLAQVHDDLLERLERIKLREVAALAGQHTPAEAAPGVEIEVDLVAHLRDGRLVPPWATGDGSEIARRHLNENRYATAIREGERRELIVEDLSGALRSYRLALRTADQPIQRAYARLMLGRVLQKAGQPQEATTHYRAILSLPSDVTDDLGLPMWLYAGTRLLAADSAVAEVFDRTRREVAHRRWFSPPEVYMVRDLVAALASSEANSTFHASVETLSDSVAQRVSLIEQTLALQRDVLGLGLTTPVAGTGSAEPKWVLYGSPDWLVSAAQPPVSSSVLVIAVRAGDVFSSVSEAVTLLSALGPARLSSSGSSDRRPLGPSFPGVEAQFAARDDGGFFAPWNLQRSVYVLTLLLVLGVTLFGANLLFLDVRRELRLAELRSQFVSGVSHELKTPLTAIRMFAETMRIRRPSDPQVQDEYLDTIINESERLTRLLNNVLAFSNIEQGKKQYHMEPSSLAAIVEATAKAMRYSLEQDGFELRVDIQHDLPPVDVDRDAIEQAILNLLTNAMKYSGDSRDIELRLSRKNGLASIEVSDSGVGIEPEEQTHIFERFYRAPTQDNDRIPGTGLGLTLVQHIAEAHGGHVLVQSTPAKGSTFSLQLPLESSST